MYVNMTTLTVNVDGVNQSTCPPVWHAVRSTPLMQSQAMGYAFAAGTTGTFSSPARFSLNSMATDGPGEFNFEQGTNSSNPFWNLVSH